MIGSLALAGVGTDEDVAGGRIVAYRDGYVFMGGRGPGGDGLIVWDVTDRSAPVKVAQVSGGLSFGRGVILDGDVAYVTGRDNGGLASYDISDPTDPTVLDMVEAATERGARGLVLDGDYLYLLCGILNTTGTDGVAAFDKSDPENLTRVARLTSAEDADAVSSGFGVLDPVTRLLWCGDYNNTSGTGDSLVAYDVTDPENPTVRSRTFSADLDGCRGIKKVGNVILLASEGSDAVVTFDVTDPDAPEQLNVVTSSALVGARDISIMGDIMFVSARGARRIVALDISDPGAPSIITSLHDSTNLVNAYGNANDGAGYVFASSTSTGDLVVAQWLPAPGPPPDPGWYVARGGGLVPATVSAA